MGVLDRFKNRGSGGFLNNVDGTIVEFVWTSQRPEPAKGKPRPGIVLGKNGVPAYIGRDRTTETRPPLFARITVRPDGADTPVERSLRAGYGDEWKISKDGFTLTPISENAELWGNAEFMQFLYSVEDSEYDITELGSFEPGASIDLSPLEEQRFHFVQKVDEAKTTKFGKRTYTSKKTGKDVETDWTYLAVSKYYGQSASLGASKEDHSSAAAIQGRKPNGGIRSDDQESETGEIATLAHKTLLGILRVAKNRTIKFADLKLKVTTALMGHALRNDVRAYLENEENLLVLDGVTYDQWSKTRDITLNA